MTRPPCQVLAIKVARDNCPIAIPIQTPAKYARINSISWWVIVCNYVETWAPIGESDEKKKNTRYDKEGEELEHRLSRKYARNNDGQSHDRRDDGRSRKR